MEEVCINSCQTVAQAAASLVSALRARGASASRSLLMNFVARAETDEESAAATVALWHQAMTVCPQADDLGAHLGG